MHELNPVINFFDERGQISDLLTEEINSVTLISFVSGAIRGNHVHYETTQWTYVVSGKIEGISSVNNELNAKVYGQGAFLVSNPGEAHAFKALEPSEILVFTKGPRSGKDYNLDTFPKKLI